MRFASGAQFTPFALAALVAVPLTACGSDVALESGAVDEEVAKVTQALGETVTTDKTSYSAGETVTATFAGLPGNSLDWVALAPLGAPNSSYGKWRYTYGARNGSIAFTDAVVGTWVARVFENNTFTLLAESAPFTVAPQAAAPQVTTDRAAYTSAENASVSYANMAGYDVDWISIAPEGSPGTAYVRWTYTKGKLSGTWTPNLTGLRGRYVARAHFNNSYNIEAESAPFQVDVGTTTVTTDASAYVFGDPVTISFTNMLGSKKDWVSVAPVGSSVESFSWWQYTSGGSSGQVVMNSFASGTFVARVYFDDSFTLAAESAPFTIAAPASLPVTLAAEKAVYSGLERVNVTFSGMAGNPNDWIGAYEPMSELHRHRGFVYTKGLASGTVQLPFLRAGTWVPRAFFADGYDLQGEGPSFTVSTAIASDRAAYASGEQAIVRFGGMSGSRTDWIAVARVGAPANTFALFSYVNGLAGGERTFSLSSLSAGSYVARAYFRDSFTIEAESAPFTVGISVN